MRFSEKTGIAKDSRKWSLLDQLHLEIGLRSADHQQRPVNRKGKFIPLADFEKVFAPSPAQAALMARDLNLPMTCSADGVEELVDVAPLVRLVRLVAEIRQFGPGQGYSRGQAARELRDGLVGRMTDAGLKYEYADLKSGTLLVFSRADGGRVGVLTYISTTQTGAEKVTFGVGHLNEKDIDWVLLVSPALGRTFAKTREELRAVAGKGAKSIGLTFRPGTPADDDFERRLPEIVTGCVRQRPLSRRSGSQGRKARPRTAREG